MELPANIRQQFQTYGRAGGRARAKRLTATARRRIARTAALVRWVRARFGARSFEALGLPGGALLDAGLRDAAAEDETVESLLVAIAAPRLIREGVPVPTPLPSEPELRLFRRLEGRHGELAHARYLALLQQVVSFSDACEVARSAAVARAEEGAAS